MWTLGVPEEDGTYSCSQFVNLDFSLTQFETYSLNHKHHGEEVGRNNNRQRCLQNEGQTQNCRRAPPSGLLITSAFKLGVASPAGKRSKPQILSRPWWLFLFILSYLP